MNSGRLAVSELRLTSSRDPVSSSSDLSDFTRSSSANNLTYNGEDRKPFRNFSSF